jgi:hypothetical protein
MTQPPGRTPGRADGLHELNESLRRCDWAYPDSVVPGGLAALGPASDPVEALSTTNIPGLIERLAPLHEAQQWFAGDPAAVTEYAEKWCRVADLARQASDLYGSSLREHTPEWAGDAADLYRKKADTQQDDLEVLIRGAESIIALVTVAGDMAGSARAHIQESVTHCVNDIITRLPNYYTVLNSGHPAALNHVLADVAAIVDGWA